MTQLPLLSGRKRRPPRIKGRKLNAMQRSLKWLRGQSWTCDMAEKYVARVEGKGQQQRFAGGFRKDLFGFIDIVAYRSDPVCIGGRFVTDLAIQTTSRQQIAPHLRGYRADAELIERIKTWLACRHRAFVLHGWECVEQPTKAGGVKAAWELTQREVLSDELLPFN